MTLAVGEALLRRWEGPQESWTAGVNAAHWNASLREKNNNKGWLTINLQINECWYFIITILVHCINTLLADLTDFLSHSSASLVDVNVMFHGRPWQSSSSQNWSSPMKGSHQNPGNWRPPLPLQGENSIEGFVWTLTVDKDIELCTSSKYVYRINFAHSRLLLWSINKYGPLTK